MLKASWLHWVWPLLTACVLSLSTLVRLQVALPGTVWGWSWVVCTSQVWDTQVQVLGCSSKAQTHLGLCFVPFPGQSISGDQVFGKHSRCDLSPLPTLPLGFLGVQLAHGLRWMLTIQNPKKSWLAMKPACNSVDYASLGPRLPPSGSGCPRLPVTGGEWVGLQQASSAQSFVLWAGLTVS